MSKFQKNVKALARPITKLFLGTATLLTVVSCGNGEDNTPKDERYYQDQANHNAALNEVRRIAQSGNNPDVMKAQEFLAELNENKKDVDSVTHSLNRGSSVKSMELKTISFRKGMPDNQRVHTSKISP